MKSIIGRAEKHIATGSDSKHGVVILRYFGQEYFDATDYTLRMPLGKIKSLKDNMYLAEEVGRAHINWDGPCKIELVGSICKFFEIEKLEDLTKAMLDAAIAQRQPKPLETRTVQVTVSIEVTGPQGFDASEVVSEMDYRFRYSQDGVRITGSEIVDTDLGSDKPARERG